MDVARGGQHVVQAQVQRRLREGHVQRGLPFALQDGRNNHQTIVRSLLHRGELRVELDIEVMRSGEHVIAHTSWADLHGGTTQRLLVWTVDTLLGIPSEFLLVPRQMLCFGRSDDDVLTLGDTRLPLRVPSAAPDATTLSRALAILHAHALGSCTGVDGVHACQFQACFGTVLDAIGTLVAHGVSVSVVSDGSIDTPGARAISPDTCRFAVAGTWDITELCMPRTTPNRASSYHFLSATPEPCYCVEVRGAPIPQFFFMPKVSWGADVIRTHDTTLRIGRVVHADNVTSKVIVYRYGVLWKMEDLCVSKCESLIIDARFQDASRDTPPFPAAVELTGANRFAEVVLRTPMLETWCRSETLRVLAKSASAWREALSTLWRVDGSDTMASVFRNVGVDAAFVALSDVSTYASEITVTNNGLAHRVASLMEKLSCNQLAVVRFLAVRSARFKVLHTSGALWGFGTSSCASGVLHGDVLFLPLDATQTTMAQACVELLYSQAVSPQHKRPHCVKLAWTDAHCETSARVGPTSRLCAYTLSIDEGSDCTLTLDAGTTFGSEEAVSVDALETLELKTKTSHQRRGEMQRIFPQMSERLQTENTTCLVNCLREVQARCLATHWTFPQFDSAENLSSLGMSVLLCMIMGMWLGCSVRILLSEERSAMVLLRLSDGAPVVVDPCRTSRNAFYVARTLATSPQCGYAFSVRVDTAVEVKDQHNKWRLGCVTEVTPNTFSVRLAFNMSLVTLNRQSYSWRRLALFENSDVDRRVQLLCKHPPKRTSSSEFPCATTRVKEPRTTQ